MSYYWFINDTNYGSTNDTSFQYAFSDPALSTLEVLVLAKIANPNNDLTLVESNRIYESSVRNSSSLKEISRLESPPFVKNGLFRKHLDARNPMTYVNYSGKYDLQSVLREIIFKKILSNNVRKHLFLLTYIHT